MNDSAGLTGTSETPGRSSLSFLYLPVLLGLTIFFYSITVVWNSLDKGNVVISEISPISVVSLVLFAVICVFSALSDRVYFSALIFVVLAFPAPINDFIPGTYLGHPLEKGSAVFPFFTHIDAFLLLGIFKGFLLNRKVLLFRSRLFLLMIICLFASTMVNFIDYDTNHELMLLVQGLFQLRYLLEFFLLLSFYRVSRYKTYILLGFAFSILFLLAEALVYTKRAGIDRLSSGSLGNNVYASAVAAALLFLLFIYRNYRHSFVFRSLLVLALAGAVVTIIGTRARMPVIAFLITFTIISYYRNIRQRSFTGKMKWAISAAMVILVVSLAARYLPKRYDPDTLKDKIEIRDPSSDLTEFIRIERSWETNSLISRLELYTASLRMFADKPVAGIGAGRWNIQKSEYGFREFLLIDSHNGYLSVLSQYGIMGLPLIIFIYISPVVRLYRSRNNPPVRDYLLYLGMINFYFCISDLSNSGIFKHQVFALLVFNALAMVQAEAEGNAAERELAQPSTESA